MLFRLGFCPVWRKWMRGCFTASSISVLVNGSPTNEFVASRGLKQGDPLAPFLFIVAAEGLAGLVRRAEENNHLRGFSVSENLSVSLLQFADDTVLLCDGGERNLWCLKAILRSFELVSGLKINYAKSNIMGVNMERRILDAASTFLSCCVGRIPFKFLGIPVGANPRRFNTWEPVLNSMKLRLSAWKSKQLSIGGRITLINSVLSHMPLYFFSFYKAPKKVVKELIKIQRQFLWGGSEEHRKVAWVKWDLICLPKDRGGLGIKNIEAFNIALLSKWKWKCQVGGESLWFKVLNCRYGDGVQWHDFTPSRRQMRKYSLWWRDLIEVGNDSTGDPTWYSRLSKLQLGNGNKLKFWSDAWCGPSPFKDLFPEAFERSDRKHGLVQQFGSWSAGQWRWEWGWTDGPEGSGATQINELKEILCDVVLTYNREDKWIWGLDQYKVFTVKSCYQWLVNSLAGASNILLPNDVQAACSKLWRNNVPTKAAVLAWRLLINKLPTRDALIRRGVLNPIHNSCCVLCFEEDETVNHLFFRCRHSQQVWQEIFGWLNIDIPETLSPAHHFHKFGEMLKGRKLKGVKHLVWIATIWVVWQMRNKILFEGAVTNVFNMIQQIKYIAWAWFMARKGRNSNFNFSEWLICPMGCLMSA